MGTIGDDPKLRAQLEKARSRSRLPSASGITRKLALSLIESCRQGTAPIRGARVLSVGREDLIHSMNNDLVSVARRGSHLRVINGDFGIGKTLTLRVLQEHAHAEGFATSFITLSPRECPMFDLASIYRHVVNGIRVGDCLERPALEYILDDWAHKVVNDPNRETITRYLKEQIEIPKHMIPWGIRDLDNNFKTVLTHYFMGVWLGSREKMDLSLRWLKGETTVSQARCLGANCNLTPQIALSMMGNLTKMLRFVGVKGLVIVLDEADAIPSLPNAVLREQAYGNLLGLSRAASSTPHSYFVYATTPAFFSGVPTGFDDALKDVCTLEPMDSRELFELAQVIRELHFQAYEWQNDIISKSSLKWFVNRCLSRSIDTPRAFVRNLTMALDVCEEHRGLSLDQVPRTLS